jgi:hypothetical protein
MGPLQGLLMGKHTTPLFVARYSYILSKLHSYSRVRVTMFHDDFMIMIFPKFGLPLCYLSYTWVSLLPSCMLKV